MANSFDPVGFVREFWIAAGRNLERYPPPFDYTLLDAGSAATRLPSRLLGNLANLREREGEIARRFTWERGSLLQTFATRKTGNTTAFDAKKRELDVNEEREVSAERERWYCELSNDEKAALNDHCLVAAGPDFGTLLPDTLPSSLHGTVARLALEVAEAVRRHRARRSEIKESLLSRGLSNRSVSSAFLNRAAQDKLAALFSLVGRWRRELTPEEQAVFDDGARAETNRPPQKPKRRRRKAATRALVP